MYILRIIAEPTWLTSRGLYVGSTAWSLKTLPAKLPAHYCLISIMLKTNFSSVFYFVIRHAFFDN